MSPGFAGRPEGTTEGLATTFEVFANCAAMLVPLNVKNAGASDWTVTFAAVLRSSFCLPALDTITMLAAPEVDGPCRLIWSVCTYVIGTCLPLTSTAMQPRTVGKAPFTKSPGPALRLRFELSKSRPKMVHRPPLARLVENDAASTTR